MRYFLTRFSFSYPKTLVFMLQSTGYVPMEYFRWLGRTYDFQTVAKRRTLEYTRKARLLLILAWAIVIVIYALTLILAFAAIVYANITLALLAVLTFVISPFIVAYIIVVPLWLGGILIQTPREAKMIKDARDILSTHPGYKIAIAGSYGKTTAKEILRTVLSEGKRVAFTPGNMNTPIGISRFSKTLDGTEEILIFEFGEGKVGDVRELSELVGPDIGVITGINEAHLSSFKTLDRTVATIFELRDHLGDKPLYKNQESSLVASNCPTDDRLLFSRKGVDGWQISKPQVDINGTRFVIKKGTNALFIDSKLLGLHNLGIMSVVVDIAKAVGLSSSQIVSGFDKTEPFEHRMQPRNLHGAQIIDDTYNGNSEGVQAGLLLLKTLDAKRKIYVTPGLVEQGNKTKEIHESIGEQIGVVADVVVLMKNSVTEYIENGLERSGFKGKLLIIDDPLEFYSNLEHFVVKGDAVLMQNDWTDNYA